MAIKIDPSCSNIHLRVCFFMILVLVLLPRPSHSADPDPLQDFCIADLQSTASLNGFPCKPAFNVTSEDFFFDGLSQEGNTSNPMKSFVTQGHVLAFPGLNTLGMSMNRVDIAPGGVTHPHIHPRATECGVLIQGKLLVGLITSGNVVYSKNMSAGQVFVIPRGLVHFQMNVGLEKVLVFTAFNSHMPGTIQVSKNLFSTKPASVPDQVLIKAFQVNQTVIDEIKTNLSK
ncbi:hypothetical protein Pfo_011230 [Paulownia fortunei]|nr:hypothetical protein Pfo_011230 [Paulownia fortunei]